MNSPRDEKALCGLDGVFVVVENIEGDSEMGGTTEHYLREDLAQKLATSGIHVLDAGEWLSWPGTPLLYVKIMTANAQDGGTCALSVSLELQQKASLLRDPASVILSTTWRTGQVEHVATDNLQEKIRDTTSNLAKVFVADYATANGE